MGFYRLLVGTHQEPGRRNFTVTQEKDDAGKVIAINQPIVPSDMDLVKMFGNEKFERVQEPVTRLLQAADAVVGVEDQVASTPTPSSPKPKGIHGRDVTQSFPAAVEHGLQVFLKPGGKHTVVVPDTGDIVTSAGPVKKSMVESIINDYMEV